MSPGSDIVLVLQSHGLHHTGDVPEVPFVPKSTKRGSAQPLGHRSHSGHCDSTISLSLPSTRHPLGQPGAQPSPISELAGRHWLYPPRCVPAGGEHTPWAEQKGKAPLLCRGLSGTQLNIHNGQAAQALQECISRHLQTMPE